MLGAGRGASGADQRVHPCSKGALRGQPSARELAKAPTRCHPKKQPCLGSGAGKLSHAFGFFVASSQLNQWGFQREWCARVVEFRHPVGPERHAALAQTPPPPTGSAKGMAHEYAEGGCASVQPALARLLRHVRCQRRIHKQCMMAQALEMPGHGGTDHAGTDHCNGDGQLRAWAGITWE